MDIVRIILTVVLVVLSAVLVVLILSQEGKSSGLSASLAGGSSDSYVSRNRGRTPEGRKEFWTKIMIAAFIIIALAIDILQ
jgi:preprotein translocase subunit SecG